MNLRATAVSILVLGACPLLAHGNERGNATATVAGKSVTIEYGRPTLKGRDMLAEAVVGQPWRMGADAATTLHTDAELSFGSLSVAPGDYILRATKIREGAWVLNVMRASEKVADVPLTASTLPASVETFTIELTGSKDKGEFTMKWGTTALKAGFTAK